MASKEQQIRLRTIAHIGTISRELEKAKLVPKKGACVLSGAAAGISTSTANRYEELAALEVSSPQLEELAGHLAAFKGLFATSQLHLYSTTVKGLHGATVKQESPI